MRGVMWWERITGTASSESARPREPRKRSVYEDMYASRAGEDDSAWVPVGEIDPLSGRFELAHPDWPRRVGGWQPLEELLRDSWR